MVGWLVVEWDGNILGEVMGMKSGESGSGRKNCDGGGSVENCCDDGGGGCSLEVGGCWKWW